MKNNRAQILVILLIALAILSILVVVVATTARRDSVTRVQNEQYEQSVATAEQTLIEVITGDLQLGTDCTLDAQGSDKYICPPVAPDNTTTTALEELQVNVYSTFESNAENLVVGKDQALGINLLTATNNDFTGTIRLTWTDNATPQISWLIAIDYKTNAGEFKSSKVLYDNGGLFVAETNVCNPFTPQPPSGGNYSTDINFATIKTNCLDAGTNTMISARFTPLIGGSSVTSTTISFTAQGGALLPQFQKLITEVYSSDDAQDSSPRAVLEVTIPLNSTPFEILDYVYRTEN